MLLRIIAVGALILLVILNFNLLNMRRNGNK